MARIYRDAHGIPHVRGTSVADVAHGQGQVTARDRAWQLEWLRRRATGTTAEVLGDPAGEWDAFATAVRIEDTARRAHAALTDETRAFVADYVAGVNAGLHADAPELTALGIEPEPWPEWMPLAVFHAQHVVFANLGPMLWRRWVEGVLGDDADLLDHEGPLLNGSNAWAVGGDRTASGLPLIGGDPHRIIESPGVYQQVRLACADEDWDVVGLAFPGVPGAPHFAHTGDVAWAITNAMADQQSLSDDPADPEVEPGVRVRDSATVLGDLGFDALLPLLRARTVDDVDRAFDRWVEPVDNVVIADRHGAVRYRIAGRIPVRDDSGAWTGWLADAHREEIPAHGEVVTANERRGPQSDSVGTSFATPYRARRLRQLLEGRTDLTPADFAEMHNDTLLLPAAELCALVPGAFEGWDLRMDAGSEQAARFAAWRSELVRRIATEPVFDPLREPPHSVLFAPWLGIASRIALALPALVAAGRPFGIDLPALAREALAVVDEAPATWGETHVFVPVHAFDPHGLEGPTAPALPVSGDSDCVRCTSSYPAVTDVCSRGAVARYVWDLADREASGWVVPLGAAGDPRSPHHHDQLDAWVRGDLVPVVTDWARLTEE